MKVTITVQNGSKQGDTTTFAEPGQYLIGRSPDMHFQIPTEDLYASRRHLMLEIAPPFARVINIGHTNPPHVNGKPISMADLQNGDELELGYTKFKVGIDTALAKHSGRCKGCGAAVELCGDEAEPTQCAHCPQPAHPAPEGGFICKYCGVDLVTQANVDGRAAEFGRSIIYCCSKCVPPGDKKIREVIAGNYEIRKRLGGGGMGDVYLVYDSKTARLLALKRMNDIKNKDLVQRFEREAAFTAGLHHPSLVRYVDRGIDSNGALFLVMQYLPDGSVDRLLEERGGTLPPDQAVAIIADTLEGLDYIHLRQIIHRDIKPANILLDASRKGQPGYAKLADFGLAYCYARAGGMRLTRPNTSIGTMMFMPPEQIRDTATVKEPGDIYSTGVSLYLLLTGSYTFDFPSPAEMRRKIKEKKPGWDGMSPSDIDRNQRKLFDLGYGHPFNIILGNDPIPIRKRDASIPARLADVVDRAVSKDITKRFRSAREMREALLRALPGGVKS